MKEKFKIYTEILSSTTVSMRMNNVIISKNQSKDLPDVIHVRNEHMHALVRAAIMRLGACKCTD